MFLYKDDMCQSLASPPPLPMWGSRKKEFQKYILEI